MTGWRRTINPDHGPCWEWGDPAADPVTARVVTDRGIAHLGRERLERMLAAHACPPLPEEAWPQEVAS